MRTVIDQLICKFALQPVLQEQPMSHSINGTVVRLPVAGGVHNGEYVSWLYCYDPIMDVWARKQDMNTKRAIHALAGMNDRLYAIGGNHLKGKYPSVSGNELKNRSRLYNLYFQNCATAMLPLWAWQWTLLRSLTYKQSFSFRVYLQDTNEKNRTNNWVAVFFHAVCI